MVKFGPNWRGKWDFGKKGAFWARKIKGCTGICVKFDMFDA